MLVSEIATRVQRQFGDEAGVQITSADIIRWVNDAQREIAIANNLLQTTATTATVVGQNQYTLPPDILTLRSVRYAGQRLRPLSAEEFAVYIGSDDGVTNGTPTHFSVWGQKIDLYPAPDTADPDDLQLYYTREPAAVTATTDTPELPLEYHNRIVEYALQQAYELDENWQAAQQKASQFQQGVSNLKDLTSTANGFYPSITTLPEDSEAEWREIYW